MGAAGTPPPAPLAQPRSGADPAFALSHLNCTATLQGPARVTRVRPGPAPRAQTLEKRRFPPPLGSERTLNPQEDLAEPTLLPAASLNSWPCLPKAGSQGSHPWVTPLFSPWWLLASLVQVLAPIPLPLLEAVPATPSTKRPLNFLLPTSPSF